MTRSTPSAYVGQRPADGASVRERGGSRISDFPILKIRGVYASRSVKGLHFYLLPSNSETSSKFVRRLAGRTAGQRFVALGVSQLQGS